MNASRHRTSGAWRHGRQAAFTLVEVLLAISLVALIMAMAYGGFRAAVRATDSGEAIIEENNRLRVVHQFMRRQLMRAQSLVIEEDEEGYQIRFQGDRERVRFIAPMPGYLSYGGAYIQEFSLERGAEGLELVYYYAMLNGYESGDIEHTDGIVLLENLDDGRFLFLQRDEEYDEEVFWTDLWEEEDRMPLAVAAEFDLDRERNAIWPDLIAPVMVDSDSQTRVRSIDGAADLLRARQRGEQPRDRR